MRNASVGVREAVDRDRRLVDVDQLEHQLPGDAGEAARVERRRAAARRRARRTRSCRCPRTARRGCWRTAPRRTRAPGPSRGRRRSRRSSSSSRRRRPSARCGPTGTRATAVVGSQLRAAARRARSARAAVAAARAERRPPGGDRDPQAADARRRWRRPPRRTPRGRGRRRARRCRGPRTSAAAGARCRVRANGVPATTFIVSKQPSPVVSPWSSSGHAAARRASTSTGADPGRARCTDATTPLATRMQAAGLQLGLRPLALGRRVPRDAAAGAEADLAVGEPERADGDVEVALPAVGVDPADGAAVHLPRRRLEPGDGLEGGELRRAGDRPGRERGVDHRRPAAPRAAAGP